MIVRSRLLASVALPLLTASIWAQPVRAENAAAPIILAQESTEPSNAEPPPPENQPAEPSAEEINREADEQMKAAEEETAQQERELQEAAEKAKQQAEAEQRAAEEEAAQQAEQMRLEAIKQAEQQAQELEAEARKVREQTEAEQRAAEEEAARQAGEQKKAAEEQNRLQLEAQKAVEEEAKREAEETRKQIEANQPESTPAPQLDQQQPAPSSEQEEEPAEQTETPVKPAEPEPEPEQEAQPVPPALNEEQTPEEQQAIPAAPPASDERSEEQKLEAAEDPASTDETVVLPVDNGAAILDSDKDADNTGGDQSREERRKQREQQRSSVENLPPPTDDATAQAGAVEKISAELPETIEANLNEEGRRIEQAPAFAVPETTNIINNTVVNNTTNNTTIHNTNQDVRVVERLDNRVVLDVGNRSYVRSDDRPRLRRNAEETYYEELPRGRLRETIVRPGGYRIVTIYDRYGDILQRSRIDRDNNEYLLLYAPDHEDRRRGAIIDVGYELPPMRLTIPVTDYIIDVADDPERDFYEFFAQPPVERVERLYTIDEVRHSARLRDKVRRIDLDTIQFATGSAEVSLSQAQTLRKVADAMQQALEKDPGETFLIEGHTDAVGSDRSNLVLSDTRAEAVAILLSEIYDIPAENLITQGYGERYLKIKTQGPEQENRRVTMRRVTPLVRPVAQR